jgi:hypothetical protein
MAKSGTSLDNIYEKSETQVKRRGNIDFNNLPENLLINSFIDEFESTDLVTTIKSVLHEQDAALLHYRMHGF